MQCKPILNITAILFLFLPVFPVNSEENQHHKVVDGVSESYAGKTDGGFISSAADLFKHHVSPIDGDRCPMYPSCSRYSREALNKHGLFMGWIMTCDRLLRCGRDEISTAPRIIVDGGLRCYDSIENNDFWWTR